MNFIYAGTLTYKSWQSLAASLVNYDRPASACGSAGTACTPSWLTDEPPLAHPKGHIWATFGAEEGCPATNVLLPPSTEPTPFRKASLQPGTTEAACVPVDSEADCWRTLYRILRPSTGYFAEVQVSSGPLMASGCSSKLSWDQNSIIAVRGTLDCNRREVFHQRCRPKQSIDL